MKLYNIPHLAGKSTRPAYGWSGRWFRLGDHGNAIAVTRKPSGVFWSASYSKKEADLPKRDFSAVALAISSNRSLFTFEHLPRSISYRILAQPSPELLPSPLVSPSSVGVGVELRSAWRGQETTVIPCWVQSQKDTRYVHVACHFTKVQQWNFPKPPEWFGKWERPISKIKTISSDFS